MKTVGITMIVLGLALAALPASAQGQTSFTLETRTEGGGGYFTLAGETQRNPTLNVEPGAEITVTLKGTDDGVHNFCVGSDCSEFVTAVGEEQVFTFTAPSSGTVEYFCQPHKGAGMKGTVSAGGAASTPTQNTGNGEGNNDTPGLGVLGVAIAIVGVALVVGRRQ